MNHRQSVQAIARRLPHLERYDVAEVLEVAAEVWAKELARPGGVVKIGNLGKLHVEVQHMRAGGAIRQRLDDKCGTTAPPTLRRLYFRFRPALWLRASVEHALEAQEE
ncbi:MAG: hypothetical protein IT323_12650 [Anaerolineae bacterium]|nr:hypothetical protein [Anaerolineae bacterium]